MRPNGDQCTRDTRCLHGPSPSACNGCWNHLLRCEYCGRISENNQHHAYDEGWATVKYFDPDRPSGKKHVPIDLCPVHYHQWCNRRTAVSRKFPTYRDYMRRSRGVRNQRLYKCSLCHERGHNAQNCPYGEKCDTCGAYRYEVDGYRMSKFIDDPLNTRKLCRQCLLWRSDRAILDNKYME